MDSAPSHPVVNANHQGATINIAIWILVVCAGLAVSLRLNNKVRKGRSNINGHRIGSDDYFIVVALASAIAQSVVVSQSVNSRGFEKPLAELDEAQMRVFEKYNYIGQIVYLFSVWMSKTSCLLFYRSITLEKAPTLLIRATISSTTLWAIGSILAVSFQCVGSKELWQFISGKCVDMSRGWTVIEVLDAWLEFIMITESIYLLRCLPMDWGKKARILFSFTFRVVDIPLIALRIVFIRESYRSHYRTADETRVAMLTQACMYCNIMATCAPFLRPLVEQLHMDWTVGEARKSEAYHDNIRWKGNIRWRGMVPILFSSIKSTSDVDALRSSIEEGGSRFKPGDSRATDDEIQGAARG